MALSRKLLFSARKSRIDHVTQVVSLDHDIIEAT